MTNYHHGDLHRALLDEAETMADTSGTETITLRALARRIGVSHSAPVHHFGTRQGLLTALAHRGFEQLHTTLSQHTDDIYAMGVEYVTWALAHPGAYAVMWQPRLLDEENAALNLARQATWDALFNALTAHTTQIDETTLRTDAYAAFSIVHGLASLWLNNALPRPDKPAEFTAHITRRLQFAPDVI